MSEFRVWYDLSFDSFSVGMRGAEGVAQPVTFEPFDPGKYREPMLRLNRQDGQQLMDELWSAGFRPVAGKQSEGVTAAQGQHLADMRQIVFAKLGIDKP